MSRTHLYRGANPAPRPLASLVLAGAWTGAALTALLATAPALGAALATGAPAATLHDRLFLVVALGGAAIGIALSINELVAGRTRWRAARLVGAALLAVAGGIGSLDTVRGVVRPGTPIGAVPEAIAAEPQIAVRTADASAAGQRLLWISLGLAGSGLVLVGGVAAARRTRLDA